MSESAFWNHQASAFQRTYELARARVPYYRERPGDYPPARISSAGGLFAFIHGLPALKKAVVREQNQRLWRSPLPPFSRISTTSGTSGTPLRLPLTLPEKAMAEVVYESWVARIFGTSSPRSVFLSGFMIPANGDLYWIDRLTGNVYLSIYSLAPVNRDAIIRLFSEVRPARVSGYASAIYQLAVLVGAELRDTRSTRKAISTSEVLQPEWREAIEQLLCGEVYDCYGSQEGCHLVTQCRAGGMHINPLVGIVEIVGDDDAPARPGQAGRVLVTTVNKRSMPLFRYELGDVAESTGYATDCPCGVRWPTIGPVGGRTEDLVRTRDGRRIGMLGYSILKELRGVRESQIVQTGYERFVCNITRLDARCEPDAELEHEVRLQLSCRLQTDVEVTFNYLQQIPRGPTGKFKAVAVEFSAL